MNVAVLLMYLLCCAACWFLVQRDVRSDGEPFNFPGMKIVPALAILAIVWILAHATVREFLVTGIVLVVSSVLYFDVQRSRERRIQIGHVADSEDCRASAPLAESLAGQAKRPPYRCLFAASIGRLYERALVLPPCATIIWRSIIRSCRFQRLD